MRTLIREGPTIDTAFCSLALSKKPLCPGKNAGLNPEMPETNVAATLPAEPIPGSADIALGIPPIGCAMRAGFGSRAIVFIVAASGAVAEKKFFGITVESCREIEPLVFVN